MCLSLAVIPELVREPQLIFANLKVEIKAQSAAFTRIDNVRC
jgi:hypothetical protein